MVDIENVNVPNGKKTSGDNDPERKPVEPRIIWGSYEPQKDEISTNPVDLRRPEPDENKED